jgi:hypothetical protein
MTSTQRSITYFRIMHQTTNQITHDDLFRKVCIITTALMSATLTAIQSHCYCITILGTLWQIQHIFKFFLRMVWQLSIEIQLSWKLSHLYDDGQCKNSCNFLILLSSYNVTTSPLHTAVTRNFGRCSLYFPDHISFGMNQWCSSHLQNVTSYGRLVPDVIRIVMVMEELRFLDNTRTYPKVPGLRK